MNYSIQPLRPLIVVVLALSLFFKFPPREEISLEASPLSSRIIARFILISSEEKDAERQSRPKKKSWFRSSNRQSTETRSFSPHPFSRVNAKALRSLTIERGIAAGWRFVYSRYGNSSLSSGSVSHGRLPRYTKHRSSTSSALELARYIIFRIYYRLFVSVQNGQAKIASRNPVPFLFFTTGAYRSFTGILKRGKKKKKKDKGEERGGKTRGKKA